MYDTVTVPSMITKNQCKALTIKRKVCQNSDFFPKMVEEYSDYRGMYYVVCVLVVLLMVYPNIIACMMILDKVGCPIYEPMVDAK